jgi:hypothetical protein
VEPHRNDLQGEGSPITKINGHRVVTRNCPKETSNIFVGTSQRSLQQPGRSGGGEYMYGTNNADEEKESNESGDKVKAAMV